MILVPRSCFKSTFFTIGRSMQAIAKDRNERILVANATLANSQKFLSEMRDHIRKNETFKLLYGDMYDMKLRWNENEFEVAGRNLGSKEATVTAVGVGGNLVSQHYSRIIADDLVNLENSSTRYQSDKVIDWWKRAFSLLDYDGEMIIIGTRWSYYELYSWILDRFSDQVDYYIRGAYNTDGSLYFPELLSEEKLEELRSLQGSYVFSSFYLNDPIDEESALIKRSQIRYWTSDLPKNMNIFAMCDPAVSQGSQADYTAIIVVGVNWNNDWYVLDARREKMTVGELIQELFSVYEMWKPITISIETIGQAQGLMTPIFDEENRRNKYLPLYEITARSDVKKEIRIRSVLQPRFERGKIYIKEDMYDLEEEILKFPRSKHEDMIDALSDLEEISFSPASVKPTETPSGGYFEHALKIQTQNRTIPADEFLGEDF